MSISYAEEGAFVLYGKHSTGAQWWHILTHNASPYLFATVAYTGHNPWENGTVPFSHSLCGLHSIIYHYCYILRLARQLAQDGNNDDHEECDKFPSNLENKAVGFCVADLNGH